MGLTSEELAKQMVESESGDNIPESELGIKSLPDDSDLFFGESLLRSIAQGITAGYSDEMLALGNALYNVAKSNNMTVSEFANQYDSEIANQRSQEKESKESIGGYYTLGEITGSVASPLNLIKIGGPFGKMLASAVVEGFGRGEGVEGSAEEALLSGVGGSAIHGAMKAVPGVGKWISKKIGETEIGKTAKDLGSSISDNMGEKLKYIYNESKKAKEAMFKLSRIKEAQSKVFELPEKIKSKIEVNLKNAQDAKKQMLEALDANDEIPAEQIVGLPSNVIDLMSLDKDMLNRGIKSVAKTPGTKKATKEMSSQSDTISDLISELRNLDRTTKAKDIDIEGTISELETLRKNLLFGGHEGYLKFQKNSNKLKTAFYEKANSMYDDFKNSKQSTDVFEKNMEKLRANLDSDLSALADVSIKKLKPSQVDRLRDDIAKTYKLKSGKQLVVTGSKTGFQEIDDINKKVYGIAKKELDELASHYGIPLDTANDFVHRASMAKKHLDESGEALVESMSGKYDVGKTMQSIQEYKKKLRDSGLDDVADLVDAESRAIVPSYEAMKTLGESYDPTSTSGIIRKNVSKIASSLGEYAGKMEGRKPIAGGLFKPSVIGNISPYLTDETKQVASGVANTIVPSAKASEPMMLRSLNDIKAKKDIIHDNLYIYSPDLAKGFESAVNSGDDKKLALTMSALIQNVPDAKDFIQSSPIKTSDGREMLSLFDDTIHDPNEVDIMRNDIMKRNDISNSDKAQMVDNLNKSGKIMNTKTQMPLKHQVLDMPVMDIDG